MPHTITFGGRDTPRDWKLLGVYLVFWAAHLVLGISTLTGALLPNDPERPLVLAWCGFILVGLPIALVTLGKAQAIEVTENGISITGTGIPFRPKIAIPRSKTIRLNLHSGSWGVFQLLVLRWGSSPWQGVYLAFFASTDSKRSIGENVAAFLGEHQIPFTTNLLGPKAWTRPMEVETTNRTNEHE